MAFDNETILAVAMVVPALSFLLVAAIVSAKRMSRVDARNVVHFGLWALPIFWFASWAESSLNSELSIAKAVVDVVKFGALVSMIYAIIVALTTTASSRLA